MSSRICGAEISVTKKRGTLAQSAPPRFPGMDALLAALASGDEGTACGDHANDGDDQRDYGEDSAASVSSGWAGRTGGAGGAV